MIRHDGTYMLSVILRTSLLFQVELKTKLKKNRICTISKYCIYMIYIQGRSQKLSLEESQIIKLGILYEKLSMLKWAQPQNS